MPKKPRVRTIMNSQHVKGSKKLLKNRLFVVSEILRLFVNVLTPNDKYPLSVKDSV